MKVVVSIVRFMVVGVCWCVGVVSWVLKILVVVWCMMVGVICVWLFV